MDTKPDPAVAETAPEAPEAPTTTPDPAPGAPQDGFQPDEQPTWDPYINIEVCKTANGGVAELTVNLQDVDAVCCNPGGASYITLGGHSHTVAYSEARFLRLLKPMLERYRWTWPQGTEDLQMLRIVELAKQALAEEFKKEGEATMKKAKPMPMDGSDPRS